MKDGLATPQGTRQGFRLSQITAHHLHGKTLEIGERATRPDERADTLPAFDEFPDHVTAYESASAGYQCRQGCHSPMH
jgi:hypothetical protein